MMDAVAKSLADPERIKRLQLRRILDSPRDEAFDRLTRLAARTLHAPVSLITFIDQDRQWFKSSYGLREPWAGRRETPLSHSFCQYVVASAEPLVVTDARGHPLVQENLAIPEIGVVAYLGVPLSDFDGLVLGSFAVIDERPRRWTIDQVEIVKDFAEVTATEIQLRAEMAQRGEAERALRQAQKMEAVGRLAGGVAHDFNNMLTAISGFAALLEPEVEQLPAASLYVSEILKAANRASALTAQLLAFGRKQTLQPRDTSLDEVVRETQQMLKRLIPASVRIEDRLDPGLWHCTVDPNQMEQVLLNLAVNARDAMPQGGLLTISVRNRSVADRAMDGAPAYVPAGEYVELSVEDTGTGMDEETLSRIFEPFFTTKGVTKGTGLGLPMVYGIVKQSGGYVWAESQPGRGSTFTVLLPRTRADGDEAGKITAQPEGLRGRGTVLLAEDETGIRMLARFTLERSGYTVLETTDGEEALEIAERHLNEIDLLLCDEVMPKLGGRQLTERLRSLRKDLPVIYMSGSAGAALAGEGALPPGTEVLQKPFTPEVLTRTVQEVLHTRTPG